MPDSKPRVLIVEDHRIILDNLVETLSEMVDAKVAHISAREKDARDWLASNHDWAIAIAIVDLFLKDGTGLGVLKALKARRTLQRVVVLSNYATQEMRTRCLHLGADQVFDKSTELDQFIEYCLEQWGSPRRRSSTQKQLGPLGRPPRAKRENQGPPAGRSQPASCRWGGASSQSTEQFSTPLLSASSSA